MAIVFNYETEAFQVVTDDHFVFVLCQTAQLKIDFYLYWMSEINHHSYYFAPRVDVSLLKRK